MANKSLFSSFPGRTPQANSVNNAGGLAYEMSPKHALAQLAATGCFNSTFYTAAEDQMNKVLELAQQVEPEFVAKVAIYVRNKGHMKDMPALLLALLSVTSPGLMAEIFDRVVDSPKMLRNFVQIMRSGVVARKSLGTLPKRLIQQWLDARSDDQIFRGSVGADPSLADVIKLVHPKPLNKIRAALYAYLIAREHDAESLPELVKSYEAFKKNPKQFRGDQMPDVPMDMLTMLPLDKAHWRRIALRSSWQTLRMNLNTFQRHDVFDNHDVVHQLAVKLRDAESIKRARVLPYQLMVAFTQAEASVPTALKNALQDAMEVAIENVPRVDGKVWVLPDVSGSMQSPVTGYRKGSTTAVQCVDVAALIAAAIVRRNNDAEVLPFSDRVYSVHINPRDSVMTNAKKLASLPSGGTNCSLPLAELNRRGEKADLVVFVSDNESWIDSRTSGSTQTLVEWNRFKRLNPKAKLVCIDLTPNTTVQAQDREDILNIGGFSDAVFEQIAVFAKDSFAENWVQTIEHIII